MIILKIKRPVKVNWPGKCGGRFAVQNLMNWYLFNLIFQAFISPTKGIISQRRTFLNMKDINRRNYL